MIIFCLVSLGIIFVFRLDVVIRSSSPPFLAFILVGAILVYVSIFLFGAIQTPATCASAIWILNVGLILFFASLICKVWRVFTIFGSAKKLKTVRIPDPVLGISSYHIIYLHITSYTFISSQKPFSSCLLFFIL